MDRRDPAEAMLSWRKENSRANIEELEAEIERLQEQAQRAEAAIARTEELETENWQLLKRARRAEAAMQEAVAREAVLNKALSEIRVMLLSNMTDAQKLRYVGDTVRLALLEKTTIAAAALLERLAGLETLPQQLENLSVATAVLSERLKQAETQVADLHAALQAALLPLEAAADALVPEARVTEAAALVDEALVAIREELE